MIRRHSQKTTSYNIMIEISASAGAKNIEADFFNLDRTTDPATMGYPSMELDPKARGNRWSLRLRAILSYLRRYTVIATVHLFFLVHSWVSAILLRPIIATASKYASSFLIS
mmetsp:Transcript_40948/g.60133  ORF Transcript_40948/g.60133 Transcript_40948/m.60133 type:complete len:112 (+) Transcript_40948:3-338(+)